MDLKSQIILLKETHFIVFFLMSTRHFQKVFLG